MEYRLPLGYTSNGCVFNPTKVDGSLSELRKASERISSVEAFIAQGRESLIMEMNSSTLETLPMSVFESLDHMRELNFLRGAHVGRQPKYFRIGAHSISDCIAVIEERGFVQIWARIGYRQYRQVMSEVIKQLCLGQAPIPTGWDVDHLFAAARGAKHTNTTPYINSRCTRLMLVERTINRGWGSFWEKVAGTSSNGVRRPLTYLTLAKSIGCAAPPSRDSSGARNLAQALAQRGVVHPGDDEDFVRCLLSQLVSTGQTSICIFDTDLTQRILATNPARPLEMRDYPSNVTRIITPRIE